MDPRMKLERSGGDLPWMVTAKLNRWIEFTVKLETISMSENDKKWSCYIGKMKDISDGTPDGDHEVPFWAMNEFADFLEDLPDKGWSTMEYKRTEDANGQNEAHFREND